MSDLPIFCPFCDKPFEVSPLCGPLERAAVALLHLVTAHRECGGSGCWDVTTRVICGTVEDAFLAAPCAVLAAGGVG